jgi:cellulose synthase/poly-beta-1,6-N-acetylglucosamine synthase-like glycosyltransferase
MIWLIVIVAVAGPLVVYHLGQLAWLACAAIELRRARRISRPLLREAAAGAGALPGVSAILLVGADAAAATNAIEGLVGQRYPDLEIIAVLDGAASSTLDTLCERFDLQPADPRPRGDAPTEHVRAVFTARHDERLLVVDKRGLGRADAWNAGLNLATRPLVLTLDADTALSPHAIAEAALPFALDPTTVAVSASVRVSAGAGRARSGAGNGLVSSLFELKEARRSLCSLGLASLDAYSGAALPLTVYARRMLVRAGGFQPRSPEPDREMLLRLHVSLRAAGIPYRIVRAADAVVWRRPPASWSELGLEEHERMMAPLFSLRLHGPTLAAPRFGALALAVPHAALELVIPAYELFVWLLVIAGLALGVLPWGVAALLVSCSLGLGLAVSLATLIVDLVSSDPVPDVTVTARHVGVSLLEQLGGRQLALWGFARGVSAR